MSSCYFLIDCGRRQNHLILLTSVKNNTTILQVWTINSQSVNLMKVILRPTVHLRLNIPSSRPKEKLLGGARVEQADGPHTIFILRWVRG